MLISTGHWMVSVFCCYKATIFTCVCVMFSECIWNMFSAVHMKQAMTEWTRCLLVKKRNLTRTYVKDETSAYYFLPFIWCVAVYILPPLPFVTLIRGEQFVILNMSFVLYFPSSFNNGYAILTWTMLSRSIWRTTPPASSRILRVCSYLPVSRLDKPSSQEWTTWVCPNVGSKAMLNSSIAITFCLF